MMTVPDADLRACYSGVSVGCSLEDHRLANGSESGHADTWPSASSSTDTVVAAADATLPVDDRPASGVNISATWISMCNVI